MYQEYRRDEEDYALATKRPSQGWPYGPKDKVVLGWKGLVVGIVVADVVFFLCWAVPSLSSNLRDAGYSLSMMGVAMVFGVVPIAFVGVAVGWPLGWTLRRIRSQWLHIAVFFAAGALICVPFGGFWSPSAWAFPFSIALAAGIGRLAIWKLVRINNESSISSSPS
jgi:hypothetical protein